MTGKSEYIINFQAKLFHNCIIMANIIATQEREGLEPRELKREKPLDLKRAKLQDSRKVKLRATRKAKPPVN